MGSHLRPQKTHISVALDLLPNQKCAWTAIIPHMLVLLLVPPVAASAQASAGCSDPLKVLRGRLLPMAFEYAFVPRGMPGHVGHVLPPDAAWRR
eukprot:8783222-Pyramimonas_sp.AAC.1